MRSFVPPSDCLRIFSLLARLSHVHLPDVPTVFPGHTCLGVPLTLPTQTLFKPSAVTWNTGGAFSESLRILQVTFLTSCHKRARWWGRVVRTSDVALVLTVPGRVKSALWATLCLIWQLNRRAYTLCRYSGENCWKSKKHLALSVEDSELWTKRPLRSDAYCHQWCRLISRPGRVSAHHLAADGNLQRVDQLSCDHDEVVVVRLHLVELLHVGGDPPVRLDQLKLELLYGLWKNSEKNLTVSKFQCSYIES